MIYTSENNWHTWRYGDGPVFGRQTAENKKFITGYNRYAGPVGSFKTEMENAAKSTLDLNPNLRPSIFFSGGVDSELILRSYMNIGANPAVYIVRYEDDINLYDVSYAITVCSILDVDYKIIDFNLKKFYENDAMQVSDEAQIDRPRMLPQLKFGDYVDGLVILGHGDMTWYRPNSDYSEPTEWLYYDLEFDAGCNKYALLHNRPAVYQWWHWTPGLILSYSRLKWFRKLINNEYYGKLSLDSTKIIGFRETYPDLIERKKKTGFESVESIIDDFENSLLIQHNGRFPYRNYVTRTIDELEMEILGEQ